MNSLLSPAPDLRASTTAPALGELSPESENGRFEGKLTKASCVAVPQFELPWHQLALKCIALRMTYEETATFCGVDKTSVKNIVRAPFFQAKLRAELEKTTTPLESLFRDSGVSAFHKIVEIMEDKTTPKATALASAKEIIDRCLGKAPQTIKHEDADATSDPVALVEQLKQQNEALRTQLPN